MRVFPALTIGLLALLELAVLTAAQEISGGRYLLPDEMNQEPRGVAGSLA
ncbi:MAG TPA: hypothetical protein VLK65_27770 [Vicinamibacteria bacterium]|nr:hypothetical protein [Vicinamibacteria bacterium]